jgi:hypothetical protein
MKWRIREGKFRNGRPYWMVENPGTGEALTGRSGMASCFYDRDSAVRARDRANRTRRKRADPELIDLEDTP